MTWGLLMSVYVAHLLHSAKLSTLPGPLVSHPLGSLNNPSLAAQANLLFCGAGVL
jgi:hypothetical protein